MERATSSFRRILTSNAMVVVYAALIALCVIFAPTRVIRFIYAEF
jgi:hypothetical protein